MGNGKKKKNLIKVVAPQHVSKADPVVISFAFWKTEELPKDVTVELIETDRKNTNDDNLTTAEDVVARYTGTLTAAADDTATLENVTLVHVTSGARSSDRVWVRLAGQTSADVVEAGIPFSPAVQKNKAEKIKARPEEFSANEGSFYELAARVIEGGPDGETLVTSAATSVRQRAFVLLAVEPLPQNNSSMKHDAGVRILETYHPNNKKAHQPRNWGELVLRLRDRAPMQLGNSGCSYAIVVMLLRYLRIDAPPPAPEDGAAGLLPEDTATATTVTLFEHHIKLPDLEKSPKHKPRFFADADKSFNDEKIVTIPQARLASERAAFVAHFVGKGEAEMQATKGRGLSKKEKKKLERDVGKFFDKKTKKKGSFIPVSPPSAKDIDESPFYEPMSHSIKAESYAPMLAWKFNILDDRQESYLMQRRKLRQHELQLQGASDYRTLEHEQYKQWVPSFGETALMDGGTQLELLDHMTQGTSGKSAGNAAGIVIPMATAVMKLFGLTQTEPHTNIVDYPDDEPGDADLLPWQRFFVRTLDRGVPIVGLVSPGQYSSRDKGGHFVIVVGYRFRPDPDDDTKKKIRFIINDPAGGRTHQYEAHDEDELNPDGVSPTDALKSGNSKKLGMKRERQGLNLIIDRRKRLSIREIRVYEPAANGSTTWDTARHARFLFFRGKLDADAGV